MTTLYTINGNECRLKLGEKEYHETMVCTKSPNGFGACEGDSGGPLVLNGVQFGITSLGNCYAAVGIDIFCSVPMIRKWIKKISGV